MKATLISISYILTITLTLTFLVLPLHAQTVSREELILHYSFDEDTLEEGEILDLSENGNNGLLRGSNLKFVEGQVNDAMEFPGAATDFISVQNLHYTDLFPELSLAVWIKTPQRSMIASWDRSEFYRFAAGDDQLGNLTFVAFDVCCPIGDWHGETVVTDDNWHHVVATFDANTKRIYVDGELDAEQATHTNDKRIGKIITRYGFIGIGSEAAAFNGGVGPSWAFKGLMDEFFIFHRAITEEEVKTLAKALQNPFAVEPANKLSITWGQIKSKR